MMIRWAILSRCSIAFLLLVTSSVIGAAAPPKPYPGKATIVQRYKNPVFAQDFPDPSVIKVGADYYGPAMK